MTRYLRFAIALFAGAAAAAAPSFDCAKAGTPVEKTICADVELSRLDLLLGRFYFAAVGRLEENASCLEGDQKRWLRTTRNACKDGACLRSVYLDRLSELMPLQPGMNVPRHLELPPRPALLWAIAPLPEELALPARVSRPMRIEGTLGFGCPECGYFLRTAAGQSHLLLPDMFIGGSSATALSVLMQTERGAKLAVQGYFWKEEGRFGYFDNRHCLFIHRLP